MVVLPSFLLGRVVGPAGRAGNTATSLVATGFYQVTPLRSVPLAAAVASSRQVLNKAPGRWGQGSDPRHDRATNNTVATAGRQVQSQASRQSRTGSDPTATTAGIIAVGPAAPRHSPPPIPSASWGDHTWSTGRRRCLGRGASSSRGGSLVLPPRPGWRDLAGRGRLRHRRLARSWPSNNRSCWTAHSTAGRA